ncbi:MAG TPA: HEAT repeat domain-containing protein [Bryobacteraceae bacterium]|nr:HEAT repeat domain-containing protein [Bryobacteraceae bacterium]
MKAIWMLAAFAWAAPAATDAGQCNEMLQQALESKNPDTRKSAVVALSLAANDNPLLDKLAGMLDDKDVPVRVAVVTGLAEIKTKAATAALERALHDEVPEVSFAAAKALYARGQPDGKAALLAVLEKESKTSSGFFTSQMREALRMMHTPRTTFLYAVRQGLGFVPLPGFGEGVASMQALLSDPGVSGRAAAALLLGKDKDQATIDGLKDALYDKDWQVRAAAVHSLALENRTALKSDLEPLTLDDKEEVRLRAAAAWLRLNAIESRRKGKAAAKAN